MSTSPRANRLQIATRMHYVLLRELGQGIDVGHMLKREAYALDVLLVCEAHPAEHELARLARAFRACEAGVAPMSTTAWRESQFAPASGFGASQLPGAPDSTSAAPRSWFDRLLS
jgi:hypothetical protein